MSESFKLSSAEVGVPVDFIDAGFANGLFGKTE
jgi:hypothetical protein